MTNERFWALVSQIDVAALDAGDEDAAIAPLEDALRELTGTELEQFEELLSQALYALDGRAYAEHAGDSGESDDGFLYARCYVVAKGRAYYESILADPRRMPDSIDQWCEALLYPHRRVWADLLSKDEADWDFDASVSYESGSNERLWMK